MCIWLQACVRELSSQKQSPLRKAMTGDILMTAHGGDGQSCLDVYLLESHDDFFNRDYKATNSVTKKAFVHKRTNTGLHNLCNHMHNLNQARIYEQDQLNTAQVEVRLDEVFTAKYSSGGTMVKNKGLTILIKTFSLPPDLFMLGDS